MGAASIDALCAQGVSYVISDGGQDVAAYNLAKHGPVCWVMAAGGGTPAHDLTRTVLPHIEAQAAAMGASQVAVTTRRRGLVRKMERLGYEITGITLRKKIQ